MTAWKRSRSLWDRAYQEKRFRDYLTAVGYELQPLRISILQNHIHHFRYHVVPTLPSQTQKLFQLLFQIIQWLYPLLLHHKYHIGGILLYYIMIRWIHERLQAGPAILIVTALLWIFTAGLSDAPREGLSAYAAFNRGFERLMGDIDANQLLAQHVAGGGGGGFMMMMNHDNNPNNNNNHHHHHNGNNRVQEERRQHERHRPQDAAVVAQRLVEPRPEEMELPEQPAENGVIRRRGKKGRKQRRTVEQRRELQQQRQVAREMGFGQNDDDDEVARLRLLEDQVIHG